MIYSNIKLYVTSFVNRPSWMMIIQFLGLLTRTVQVYFRRLRPFLGEISFPFFWRLFFSLWNQFWSIIDTLSQFRQHFTTSFCADFLSSESYKHKPVSAEKLRKTVSYEKAAFIILVKLTSWARHLNTVKKVEKNS